MMMGSFSVTSSSKVTSVGIEVDFVRHAVQLDRQAALDLLLHSLLFRLEVCKQGLKTLLLVQWTRLVQPLFNLLERMHLLAELVLALALSLKLIKQL